MKKLFVSILALAAFAACQSDFNDVNFDAPQGGSNVNVGGAHTVYAEVGVGEEDTKATYGDGLKATWEESDQIALLQEHADYNKPFSVVNKLNIKDGWGTSKALFNGDISVDATAPRIYHIAYPASAVKFTTTVSQEVVEESMTFDGVVSGGTGSYAATGYAKCTYESTLTVTVPTTQSGKWEPYMYASTSEAVNSEAIGAKTLTTLNGAIAIRAYEADGVTPKQLKQITITSSSAALAGAFIGTATSAGNTTTITGAKSSWGSDLFEGENMRTEASNNLKSALQGYEATSTTVTKALSLSFAGSEKSITATNIDAIASEADGNYTYYVNVAPATLAAGTLTIVAVDANGSSLTRVVNKDVVVTASHRVGFNLTWESATLKGATIETWYNDWNKGSQFQLVGNTLYVDNISVEGNIATDHIKAIGVRINGTFHEASAQSGVKAISPIVLSGMTSGVYKVQPVAQVELNGELVWLEGGAVTKTITSIPTVIDYSVRTSYSSNGNVAKTNDINGDILRVKANISDSYVANNLVNGKTYTICYGSNTATQTLGSEKDITLAYGAWGQYVCYVKILLGNGYVVESDKYTTHVTGIPYTFQFYQSSDSAVDNAGWKRNGTVNIKEKLLALREGGIAGSGNGWVASPAFHIPAAFSTSVTIDSKYYTTNGGTSSASIYVGATSSATTTASSYQTITIKGTVDTSSGSDWKNNTVTVNMPAGKMHTSINHNGAKSGIGSRIYVAKFNIKY